MEDDVRRELDGLHQDIRDVRLSVQELDNHGSRGVIQLQAQITELIRDTTELKSQMTSYTAAHGSQHSDERQARIVARRWFVGVVVAGAGGITTVITMLLDIAAKVHGG